MLPDTSMKPITSALLIFHVICIRVQITSSLIKRKSICRWRLSTQEETTPSWLHNPKPLYDYQISIRVISNLPIRLHTIHGIQSIRVINANKSYKFWVNAKVHSTWRKVVGLFGEETHSILQIQRNVSRTELGLVYMRCDTGPHPGYLLTAIINTADGNRSGWIDRCLSGSCWDSASRELLVSCKLSVYYCQLLPSAKGSALCFYLYSPSVSFLVNFIIWFFCLLDQ